MLTVYNKDTRTTSMTLFSCLYVTFEHISCLVLIFLLMTWDYAVNQTSFTTDIYDYLLVSFCERSSLILLSNVRNLFFNNIFINLFYRSKFILFSVTQYPK